MTDPGLQALTESCLDLRWHFDPVEASLQGLTAHDGRLGSFDEETVREYLVALRSLEQALEALDPPSLADEIDRTALLNDVRARVERWRVEQPHERNPIHWVSHVLDGLYVLLVREDRGLLHRARAARQRLEAIPGYVETAQTQLHDCPAVFVEAALEMLAGGLGLVRELTAGLESVAGPDFTEVGQRAIASLEGLAGFLRDAERTEDGFAIGEEAFNTRLRLDHATVATSSALMAYGQQLVERSTAELTAAAHLVMPGVPWTEVVARLREDRPAPGDTMDAYRAAVERSTAFVRDRGLMTIPEGRIRVRTTPSFLRPLLPFAAYDPPGPFSSGREGTLFVSTPEDAHPGGGGPVHSRHSIIVAALHESCPGHHLQFLHAHDQPRLVRRIVATPMTYEGWALYGETLMDEEGLLEPEERVFQRLALLWRAVRVVLDIGLHTRSVSVDGAATVLQNLLRIERDEAMAEVRRYCTSPTLALSYAVGRRQLLALREACGVGCAPDERRRFHDAVLAYGGLPVNIIRWGLTA